MTRPPPQPPATTYTSIPLSPVNVISQSVHNFMTAVSSHRPWTDFAASGGFDWPESLSSAVFRARTSIRYFCVNYLLIVGACAALALFGTKSSLVKLLVLIAITALWLLLHFFREDPIIVWGKQVGNRIVLAFLAIVSIWAVWFTGCLLSLVPGLGVGSLICLVHAIFRNPNGLFLDEDQAFSGGLIGYDRR